MTAGPSLGVNAAMADVENITFPASRDRLVALRSAGLLSPAAFERALELANLAPTRARWARALEVAFGVGGTIATLHPVVEERVHALCGIPDEAQVVYCMPLGYPRGEFGSVQRKPLTEVCGVDGWGNNYPG